MRRKVRVVHTTFVFVTVIFLCLLAWPSSNALGYQPTESKEKYPLTWRHIHSSTGSGGAWYIPSDWLAPGEVQPQTILEAARVAARVVNATPPKHLAHSSIPRIIHQTWKSTDINQIPDDALGNIESWLQFATRAEYPSMAYFMWRDDGMVELMNEADPVLLDYFNMLPKMVEKTDIFRIVVCNMIGGVYADVDTVPLHHPSDWIQSKDLKQWTDSDMNTTYGPDPDSSDPVELILGIEADTYEDSDSFWRMGYTYPVQLTQWALASAADQAVLNRFLRNFQDQMDKITTHLQADKMNIVSTAGVLDSFDPLELTGPVAITKATMDYLAEATGLRWQALSGLDGESRGKVAAKVLILPITGFSPGRKSYGNMGSKPYSDPDARLGHSAQGSWKKTDLLVELGKACRTFLGGCRSWSKVPQH